MTDWHKVGDASALRDGGPALVFPVLTATGPVDAFVVRFRGNVYGYLNQCAHVPMPLDWNPGEFFDEAGEYLVCATHGALYRPNDGYCAAGPCRGKRLRRLEIQERDGGVYWQPSPGVVPADGA